MSTHFSTATSQLYAAYDADEVHAALDVTPGERIGAPPFGRRKALLLRLAAMTLVTSAVAGTHFAAPTLLPELWSKASVAAAPALEETGRRTAELWSKIRSSHPMPEAAPAAIPAEPASAAVIAAPPPATVVAIEPAPLPPSSTAIDPAPATAPAGAPAAAAPLPKPKASEPHQKRAVAAGLHPGLSRALLERLSDADYRNAAVAIERAVAETPDNGLFTWPKPRKAGQALFEVSFVPSESADCRRYIVTIAKDGWLTTALPLEKCGLARKTAAKKA